MSVENLMELNAIVFTRKNGSEPFIATNKQVSLVNFWQWAYSDLIGNTERGILAEYMVALACNIDTEIKISWNAYDMLSNEGIRIEVKSSAYLQTWKQKAFSKPLFNIAKTYAWDYSENVYETEKKRQSHVYVFALVAHRDKETLNPLDTHQWEFYVISTKILDQKLKNYKTVSLSSLLEIGAVKCIFSQLHQTIQNCYSNTFTLPQPL